MHRARHLEVDVPGPKSVYAVILKALEALRGDYWEWRENVFDLASCTLEVVA